MLWTKLLLSPMPHARITRLDLSAALAMPGVKAIVTADDLPEAQSGGTLGENVLASTQGEKILTKEPAYEGEPILAVAAVDELTAAEAIERIVVEYEPLPFAVDPFVTLHPDGPNARTQGNTWYANQQAAAGGRAGAGAGAPAGAAAGATAGAGRQAGPAANPANGAAGTAPGAVAPPPGASVGAA